MSRSSSFLRRYSFKKSYLAYYIEVLKNVSFDKLLLRKEYTKAVRLLQPEEKPKLDRWMRMRNLRVD